MAWPAGHKKWNRREKKKYRNVKMKRNKKGKKRGGTYVPKKVIVLSPGGRNQQGMKEWVQCSRMLLWWLEQVSQEDRKEQQSASHLNENAKNNNSTPGMLFYANSSIRNLHAQYVSSRETRDRPTITSAFGSEHIFYCPTRKVQCNVLWSRR